MGDDDEEADEEEEEVGEAVVVIFCCSTFAHGSTDARLSLCQVPQHFKREPAEKDCSLACQVCLVRRAVATCASS